MKLNEIRLTKEQKIIKRLESFGFGSNSQMFEIRPDGKVDLFYRIDIPNRSYSELGIEFGKVHGTFTVRKIDNFKSFEGFPEEIINDPRSKSSSIFTIEGNNNIIKNLVGLPIKIAGYTNIQGLNALESLEGIPQEIGGSLVIHGSPHLESFDYLPKSIKGQLLFGKIPNAKNYLAFFKVKGITEIKCLNGGTNFRTQKLVLDIINKHYPKGDMIECQEELIEAGFSEYARLK